MLKKGIALTLALVLAIALFGGCSNTNAPAATATPAPEATPAPTEEATPAPTEEATPAPTEEATPAPTEAASLMPWTGDPVTLKAFAADVGVKESTTSPVYDVYKKAVGNINIEWELVPFSDFDTKGNIYLNSGEVPDLMWNRIPSLIPFCNSDMFVDFNKNTDVMPNWVKASQENTGIQLYKTANGENFIFANYDNDYPGEGWFYNKTLLDELGLTVPKTLTELEAAFTKVMESKPDVAPFITFWNTGYYKQVFSTSLNSNTSGGVYFDMADKKWKYGLNEPTTKYKELVALLTDYYKKGYLNKEFTTMSDDAVKNVITSNKWLFTYTYHGQVDAWYGTDVSGEALPIDIQPMIPPVAEGVKPKTYPTYVSDSPYWAYVVSAKTKDPKLACALLDTLFGDEISTAFQWGIEGTSYSVDADGKKQWIDSFLKSSPTAKGDLGIWNILFPRYITKRDDRSSIMGATKLAQASQSLAVNAIQDGSMDCFYPRLSPTFTTAESDEISAIGTSIDTILTQGEAQFILGQRDMSEWDKFVQEVNAAGDINRMLEIYNNAQQKPDRIPSSERNYVEP